MAGTTLRWYSSHRRARSLGDQLGGSRAAPGPRRRGCARAARCAHRLVASTGSRAFVSADGRTTFALIYPRVDFAKSHPYHTALPTLHSALRGHTVLGVKPDVTGATILADGGQGGGNSVLVETLLAAFGALIGHYNWVIPDRVARLLRVQRLLKTSASRVCSR